MPRSGSFRLLIAPLLCAALVGGSALAGTASRPDWARLADVETVEVVTVDEDGSARETTVWLAVVDGQGYVRTGDTRWGANLERDPQLALRVGDAEYALRVEMIEDEALRARVVEAFRDKYGWSDAMISVFRSSHPRIMRLLPR